MLGFFPLPFQTYEDLDEIIARFVQPMASFAKDLISHKSYRTANGGNIDELKRLLIEEKASNPKRIPYFFSASKQLPGKFCLGYQPGSKPRVEYLTVTPDGFRYRNRVHGSVNSLIKWFKEHYADPVPRPVQMPSGGGGGGMSMGGSPWRGGGGGGGWSTTQTPGRTPAYTPSQTPHSMSSVEFR